MQIAQHHYYVRMIVCIVSATPLNDVCVMWQNKAILANDVEDLYHLENGIIVNGFVAIVSSRLCLIEPRP